MDKQPLSIRSADINDAEPIARIYNHYVDEGGATFDNQHWTTEQTVALIRPKPNELPEFTPDAWFVAEYEDNVIGWAAAKRYSNRFGYRRCCESAIYLDANHVGMGVGDALQQRIDQHCEENNIHHLVAKIVADNDRSMGFHYRHGFQLVGIQKEIGEMGNGWIDVAILQKLYETHLESKNEQ